MNNPMHMPIIQALDYQGKLHAQNLVNRGAPEAVIYFWYNITQGSYTNLPRVILEKDIDDMCRKYPEFKDDFNNTITP